MRQNFPGPLSISRLTFVKCVNYKKNVFCFTFSIIPDWKCSIKKLFLFYFKPKLDFSLFKLSLKEFCWFYNQKSLLIQDRLHFQDRLLQLPWTWWTWRLLHSCGKLIKKGRNNPINQVTNQMNRQESLAGDLKKERRKGMND